ncbi:MAG: ABC transporter substrate-binding protein [Desulfobacteraceae bacterium]
MKFLTFAVACFIVCQISFVSASEISPPEKKLQTSVDIILSVLENETLSIHQKEERIVEIIDGLFDLSLMGKLCLGRQNWSRFSSEEKSDYITLFDQFLKDFYTDKIELFNNEKVVFSPGEMDRNKITVPTHLISNGEKISMHYKMYQSHNAWKVYDVEIEGVSIIKTYRSQFNQILEDGSPKDLLNKLKEKEIKGATYN